MRSPGNPEVVRFRADPQRIRVSLRRGLGAEPEDWRAVVEEVGKPEHYTVGWSKDPSKAIMLALERAMDFPGVDWGMEWCYDHPWRRVEEGAQPLAQPLMDLGIK